jgi:hypothetical protein
MEGSCAICNRAESLTRHHLIPRARHSNRNTRREFHQALRNQTIGVCNACHKQIHVTFPEKELERVWKTAEKLKPHPALQTFAQWISSKPRGFGCRTHGKWT